MPVVSSFQSSSIDSLSGRRQPSISPIFFIVSFLPALLPHPPNLTTLGDEPLLERLPPPIHPQDLLHLTPPDMKPLADLVAFDIVIYASALQQSERTARVARHHFDGAAQRRLQAQVDVGVRVELFLVQARHETAEAEVRVAGWVGAAGRRQRAQGVVEGVERRWPPVVVGRRPAHQ